MAESFSSQHTNTFPEFLDQFGISLLVSTYQAGKLIHLRYQEGVLNTHFLNLQKPMGIALRGSRLAVGSAYQVWDCYNMPDVAPKVMPPNTHDASYLPRDIHITGDIDIHEMAFTDDNELWVVNTKMSCLCTLSPEHSVTPRWRPPFITEYDLTDRCHLNGLAMCDGKPTYISALGKTNTAMGWRENIKSGGILMEVETNRMISSGLSMPHSPRWHQDKLWVLESGTGSLATVDLETGELSTIVELPGFTRGLDFIGRYAIIGLSQVRETAVFAGLPLTERCQERQCGVYIVDTVKKETIAYMVFTGDIQEVFSVQIVPSKFPVVLSMDDPLLRSSFSLPDDALQNISEPDPEQIQLERANTLVARGKLNEAIIIYKNFVNEYPNNNSGRLNLGFAYLANKQWQAAIDSLQGVIDNEKSHADAYNALGQALEGLKQWDKAIASYDKAIIIDQQFATARVNRSIVLLRLGQFKEGWKEFEWRWKVTGINPMNCYQSQWLGENIAGKTILVHTEQSDSDIILCARFLPHLANCCGRILVMCDESFRLFFKSIQGVDEVRVTSVGISEDHFDVYIPIMSLPAVLKINNDKLAVDIPFWQVQREIVVAPLKTKKQFQLGIVWKNDDLVSSSPSIDSNTKIKNLLNILSGIDDIQCYSLQGSLTTEELELLEENKIINLERDMVSHAHTGALIKQLDLVLAVDGSVLHLSASLEVKTILLQGSNPKWYWMEEATESCWYPEVKIINEVNQLMSTTREVLLN